GVAGDVAGGGRGSADARRGVGRAREGGRSVAVDQAGVGHRQGRQGRRVDLGLIVGGDGQAGRAQTQGAGDIADAVVGVGGARGRSEERRVGDVGGGGGGRADARRR